jgi:hypothetical protein
MKLRLALPIIFVFAFPNLVLPVHAQVVPGTGQQIKEVFDDFEDPDWNFTLNLPKSSSNIDKTERHPSGFSANRLYLESLYRGTPDYVKRCETPPGGIPGSKGSLAMQTLNSGIPGRTSHTFQQDDLIAGVQQKLGYMIPVSWTPSYTCRVYVPPFDKWERRHGSHFGFRADCTTTITKTSSIGRIFKSVGTHRALEQYWPGFFIQLNLKEVTREKEDYAAIVIRGDKLGHEVAGPKITHPGWWTLGMSFTPDGRVHYYGHEGVANLTSKDHLYSDYPYDYRCEQTSTFFFNIVNQDDGHSWSTKWIVDDPKVYVATGSYRPPVQQVAQAQQQPAQKPAAAAQPQAAPQAPAAAGALPAAPTTAAPATSSQPQPTAAAPQAPAAIPINNPVAAQPAAVQQPAVQPVTAPAIQKPVQPQTRPGAYSLSPQSAAKMIQPAPAAAAAMPAAPTAVSPTPATTTKAAATAPSIPQLAAKPTEVKVSAPKPESSTENPGPTPAPVSGSSSQGTKPAPSAPVIEGTSASSSSPTLPQTEPAKIPE